MTDGGPAFPRTPRNINTQSHPGMTLRDYFAAAALSTVMTVSWEQQDPLEYITKMSYRIADAMLKEREK